MIVSLEHRVNPGKSMRTTTINEEQTALPAYERVSVGDTEPDYPAKPNTVATPLEKHRKPGSIRNIWPHFHLPKRLLLTLGAIAASWHLLPPSDKGPQIAEMPPQPQTASVPAKLPASDPTPHDSRKEAPGYPTTEQRGKFVASLDNPAPTPNPVATFDPLKVVEEVKKAVSLPVTNPIEKAPVPTLPTRKN